MEYMNKRFWLIIGFRRRHRDCGDFLDFCLAAISPTAGSVSGQQRKKRPLQKGELEAIAGYKKGPTPEAQVQTAPVAQWSFPVFKRTRI